MYKFSMILGFACASLFHTANAAIKPLDFLTSPSLECEFYLSHADEPTLYLKWFHDALNSVARTAEAFTAYSPKAEALAAIGLPPELPEGAELKIEAPASDGGPYWLRVVSGETELASYPFHVPPLYVWKKMEYPGLDEDLPIPSLAIDVDREDPKQLALGSIIGEFAEGRKFISVRREFENFVTVSVGIHVDSDNHELFTKAFSPQLVVPAEDERDEKLFSRIEVLTAHFPISPKKVPRPRPSKPN